MTELQFIEIPKIEDENIFENLCKDIYGFDSNYENVQRNGVRGQRQDGVDVFARRTSDNSWIGIQCKVRKKGKLSEKEIEAEILKALNFNPRLTKFYIYTTANRDTKIQEHVRIISDEYKVKNNFDISIIFWDDIAQLLKMMDMLKVN